MSILSVRRAAPLAVLSILSLTPLLAACGEAAPSAETEAAAEEYERGPHRGRMLRDGDFALEVTIFEDGVDPQYRLFAYLKDAPIPPAEVQARVTLGRLGGETDVFAFSAQDDYLVGDGVVTEPHSFDVTVEASRSGALHRWVYQSYEGRTTISAEAAAAGGIKTEIAGPATLIETVDLAGRLELQPQGEAQIRAQYPGRIVAMPGEIGRTVKRGDLLARIESSESLRTYEITAPFDGVILARSGVVGSTTTDEPLYILADVTKLHAEFFVYPRDAARIRPGQKITIRGLFGDERFDGEIEVILPTADLLSQTVVAHVPVPYLDGTWRPGMAVEGVVAVGEQPAELAVRTQGLQPFRDFTVVYAKSGDTYEVRMLELGRRTPEWVEVLGGLKPGTEYVTDGSFLIRADIEKSGASHDH